MDRPQANPGGVSGTEFEIVDEATSREDSEPLRYQRTFRARENHRQLDARLTAYVHRRSATDPVQARSVPLQALVLKVECR